MKDSVELRRKSSIFVQISNILFFTAIVLATLLVSVNAFAQVAFKDKPECEAHYNACSVTLYQYVLRAQEAEEKLWEVFCDTDVAWRDDSGLWKPVSNRGTPVVLLPAQYLGAKVEVYGPTGKKVADGIDRGGLANEDRAHFDITTKDLPFESRVVITRGETVECRYVLDPSKRYE